MARHTRSSSLKKGVIAQGERKTCCVMKKKTLWIALFVFVVVIVFGSLRIFFLKSNDSEQHINTIINSQIVGQLMRGNESMDVFSCTLFLLGESFIVTADHCAKSQQGSSMTRVILGGKNFTKLAEAIEYPNKNLGSVRVLDLGISGDIKVMDGKNLNLSKGTENFKLPSSDAKLPKELKMQIMKSINSFTELLEITLPVIDEQTCCQMYIDLNYKLQFYISDNDYEQAVLFCAGYSYIKGGNSGAPIYAYDENGNKILYGILSLGPVDEKSTAPSIFVDIRPYVTKITDYQKRIIEASLKQRTEIHEGLSQ